MPCVQSLLSALDWTVWWMLYVDHGRVYAAGSNVNAQLGLGNQSPHVSTPARVCQSAL